MITSLLETLYFACTLDVEDTKTVFLPWRRSRLKFCDKWDEVGINLKVMKIPSFRILDRFVTR
jgi:hypothetical protein